MTCISVVSIIVSNMVSITMICIGCGSDISNVKGKRLLSTEASQHVKPLWCKLFDDALEQKGIQAQASPFVTTIEGRMCRRCFTCFERCTKLMDSLRKDVDKAVEVFQHDHNYFSVDLNPQSQAVGFTISTPSQSFSHPPAPKRVAVDSQSPDVVVCIVYLLFLYA